MWTDTRDSHLTLPQSPNPQGKDTGKHILLNQVTNEHPQTLTFSSILLFDNWISMWLKSPPLSLSLSKIEYIF